MTDTSSSSQSTRFSATLNALTIGFLIALGLTGAVAATAHLVTGRVIDAQSTNAIVVNLSGRQRMLSQRMALLATRWTDFGLEADRQRLEDATVLFEQTHADLLAGKFKGVDHPPPGTAVAVYFGDPYQLDEQVREFVAYARRALIDSPTGAEAADRMSQMASPSPFHASALLGGLNRVVSAYQIEHDVQIARLEVLQTNALIVLILSLGISALLILFPLLRKVNSIAASLNTAAVTDSLTGVSNRHGFELRGEIIAAQRREGAVLLLDIDHFKQINDDFGHAAGDAAIQHLSATATALMREGDVFGRLGGDEFGAVLHDISKEDAEAFAERLRIAAENRVEDSDGLTLSEYQVPYTISIGVRTFIEPTPLETLMRDADGALYEAKHAGRNCVRATRKGTTIPFPARRVYQDR